MNRLLHGRHQSLQPAIRDHFGTLAGQRSFSRRRRGHAIPPNWTFACAVVYFTREICVRLSTVPRKGLRPAILMSVLQALFHDPRDRHRRRSYGASAITPVPLVNPAVNNYV